MKQFLLHLNQTGALGNFLRVDLDETHIVINLDMAQQLEEEVQHFTESNISGRDLKKSKRKKNE